MSLPERVFVLAGNFSQFRFFKRHLERKMVKEDIPFLHQNIVYIEGADRLRGYRNIHGYKVGTWWERKDLDDIEDQLKIIDSFDNFIEIDDDFYNEAA